MRSIDERIVDMQFNNKQFEDGIQTSLKSLDDLKNGLGKVDGGALEGLATGVETIADKFSTLGIIAITALQNITNRVIDTGIQLAKSLSVDQITAGFSKYEDKTKAVQTILAATGLSMEDVNKELEKLVWFTDETSYNFVDMVSNIGKFTSSGIDLKTSVTAMEGIANWAALSGQGANEASRAMYNLAQSIGMGAVKLQDWKSIENANMATKEFKETVIETALSMGALKKNAYGIPIASYYDNGKLKEIAVEYKNFSSTLQTGWFDSDILMKSLGRYGNYSEEVYKISKEMGITASEAMTLVSSTGMELGKRAFKAAQEAKTFTDAINATKDAVSSGWMNTFEILIGDYEEARDLWTNVANELWEVFAASSESRNEMLSQWKEMGGRNDLLDVFSNLYKAIKSIISPIKEAFQQIFPPLAAERLFGFTEGLKELTEKLTISDETADKLRRTFAVR
ncbi:hypothetical protein FACS1894132_14140 [Clostridia bacterium]|nr:hypothetical protein FACS1894132_14140 [Clostridia bacterium]